MVKKIKPLSRTKECQSEGCHSLRMKRPGNSSLYFKFCESHQISFVLKQRKEMMAKDKEGLEVMRKRLKENKSTRTPKQVAMRKADDIFSKYVRLNHSYADKDGDLFCFCYTCKKEHHIIDIENGHFLSRQYKTTRYNEDNCRPQCTHCNCYKHGEHEKFEAILINEIGIDRLESLKVLGKEDGEDTIEFYEGIFNEYSAKFKELVNKRQIESPWKRM
jgi:hypothetical protein